MDFEDHKPSIFMILLQFIYTGLTLISRSSLLEGMNPRVFVVYRQSIATLLIAPLAYFYRSHSASHLTWKSFGIIFMMSLTGVTLNQNLYYEGLYLSSSSMASALSNVLPAITFLIAFLAGMEKINIRSRRSIAKIVGTIICVTGAVSMVLLKGPKILNKEFFPSINLLFGSQEDDNWLLGCFLILAANFFWSIWLILQVPACAYYPDHLSLTGWTCFLSALQCACVTFVMEDLKAWRMNSYKQVSCCFYAGGVSAIAFFTQAWCVSRRGPVFPAVFNPLLTVLVTIFAAIILREQLYIGSLIGAAAVIFGLYTVLWGKAEEKEKICSKTEEPRLIKECEELEEPRSTKISLEEPLLRNM